MSDRIARIFVDSNYRTNIEDSHGNFSIDLPLGVLVEAGSHLRVEGLVISHAWPTLDIRNSHIFLREVVGGVSYHRVVRMADGNFNISTLAVELQRQLRVDSHITDGLWSVSSSDEGVLTIGQSSVTFDSALLACTGNGGKSPQDASRHRALRGDKLSAREQPPADPCTKSFEPRMPREAVPPPWCNT